MARRNPPRKVTDFEPVAPRLARNTIIESTFEVGRRFRCTMRIDCSQLAPGAVIRPAPAQAAPFIFLAAAFSSARRETAAPQGPLSNRRPSRVPTIHAVWVEKCGSFCRASDLSVCQPCAG